MESIRRWILAGGVCAAALGAGMHPTFQDSSGAVLDSVRVAQAAVEAHPKDARAFVRLGHAYLKAVREKEAMGAFRKAVSLNKNLAEGYNGVGLVFLELKKDWQLAEKYFRQALQKDRSFAEAQYNIARAHMSVGNAGTRAARGEAERVVKIDPTYAPAYLILAEWHKVRQKHNRAIEYYRKYMVLRPEDQEVGYNVGLSLLMQDRYDEAETFAMAHLNAGPRYGVLAQVMMHRQDYVKALQAFDLYVDYLPPEERAYYEDLSLVASPEELAEYRETPGTQQADFLRRFWLEHDPELVSGGTRRRAEHYRRVWYARTHFSDHTQPWDRRGEVYIRYGEPDYRSTSREMNFEVPIEVRQVQESMAFEIYGPSAAGASFYGPVYPVRTDKTGEFDVSESDDEGEITTQRGQGAVAAGDTLGLARYRPVTSGFQSGGVPWESWVYLDVDGGVEITFTDEFNSGIFDFAPVPSAPDIQVSQMSKFWRFSPSKLYEQAVALSPDYYVPEYETKPFDFYYTLADFRGKDDSSVLEIYYGIPCLPYSYDSEENVTRLAVTRQLALLSTTSEKVYRRTGDIMYQRPGNQTGPGAVLPDMVRLDVPPGVYRLEVKIRDRLSGRLGLYRQQVVVEDYHKDRLRVSDIQLANRVVESDEGGQFSKRGLNVIPMPSRTYHSGQNIFVFYEIYNLKKDEFGQTNYRVQYTMGPKTGGVLAKLVHTLTGKKRKEGVAIGYDQLGFGESEVAFTELDLGEARSGRHYIKVEVTDLVNGNSFSKETTFVVAK